MKNRKLNITFYAIAIVLTILVVSVTGYNIYSENSKTKVFSLERKYSDAKSMYEASDIIVIAEVKKVNEPIIIDRRDYYLLGPNHKKEDFMPSYSKYIVSEVKVDKVLKGDIEKDKIIEVIQETPHDTISDLELKKVKIFKDKEKYVLFLKHYNPQGHEQARKDFKTSKYYLVGTYYGQLEIVDNKVKVDKEKRHIFNNDMTVEEIEKAILKCGTK